MKKELFPILEVTGSHYDIGYAHGLNYREQVLGSIESYKDMFKKYSNIEWEKAKEYSKIFVPVIESYNSDYIQEIRGVSDGAGVDFESVLALNCRSELVFAGDKIGTSDGCTSLGVTADGTKNGDTIVAHNWDWKPSQLKNMVILKIKQENKPDIFTITEGGIIGKTGFNSSGISVFLNALGTDAKPEGVPLHMIMRSILDCETIGEVIRECTRVNIGCCANFLIGHSNGEVVDIEIENEDFDVLYPDNDIMVHTNHFLSNRLPIYPRKDTVKYKFTDSYLRLGRTRKLLDKDHGNIDEKIIANILRDHVDLPNSICAHKDEKLDEGDQTGTVFSIIINLTKGKIMISHGSPCENEYMEYKLS